MLSPSELKAIEDALRAHAAYIVALRRELEKTSRLDILSGTRKRAQTIVDEAEVNHERFKSRRSDLVEADPSDHEAVAAFVSSVRKIAGSPLPKLIATERESGATAAIVGGALADTAKDIGGVLKFGIPLLLVAGVLFLVWEGGFLKK
jgi:hypothetical protein